MEEIIQIAKETGDPRKVAAKILSFTNQVSFSKKDKKRAEMWARQKQKEFNESAKIQDLFKKRDALCVAIRQFKEFCPEYKEILNKIEQIDETYRKAAVYEREHWRMLKMLEIKATLRYLRHHLPCLRPSDKIV